MTAAEREASDNVRRALNANFSSDEEDEDYEAHIPLHASVNVVRGFFFKKIILTKLKKNVGGLIAWFL